MVLTVILLAGFVGLALTAALSVLAFIDVAFNVWESVDRANREARHAAVPRAAEPLPAMPSVRAPQWAQTA